MQLNYADLLIIIIICIIVISLYAYPIYKYTLYINNLNSTFEKETYIKTQLVIDKNNFLCIPGSINNKDTMNFIIDTKATSLMGEGFIQTNGGKYWGKLPFQMTNAYNQKQKIKLYQFDKLVIGRQTIKNPLFTSIAKNNSIYELTGNGIIGSEILSIATWKFDLEKKTIDIFHCENHERLKKETNGFLKIENGLVDEGIALSIASLPEKENFTLDLGFSGDIEINNNIRDMLIKVGCPYYKIKRINRNSTSIDSIYVFKNIPIKIDTFEIKNCELVNISSVNHNYIGCIFMRNFNFVLMYGDYIEHEPQKHLFIKRIDTKKTRQSYHSKISKFGLNIVKHNEKIFIRSILENGVAEKKNLILGDEIIEIENFDLLSDNLTDNFISYTENLDSICIKTPNKKVELRIE